MGIGVRVRVRVRLRVGVRARGFRVRFRGMKGTTIHTHKEGCLSDIPSKPKPLSRVRG